MFNSNATSLARVASSAVARTTLNNGVQARSFAVNPNEVAKRITSTKSIEKITKSMKMVSAAKLRGDTQRLMDGRPFSQIFSGLVGKAEIPEEGVATESEFADVKNPLYVMISSDRGLCGGVNSYCTKRTKLEVDTGKGKGLEPGVFIIGERGAGQLRRTHGTSVVASVDENWKQPMNFTKACNITERVIPALGDGAVTRFVFNQFRSAILYETAVGNVPNFPAQAVANEESGSDELPFPLSQYEIEPDVPEDFMRNFHEFTLASTLYGACVENATSEQSARMTAMDNASKNAGEMIDSLTVLYNRARQSRITTELIEIISGAESLKG